MATREDLKDWVLEAVKERGGEASVVGVARELWAKHEGELRQSGDLFYTWQYDMRWAATRLRHEGYLAPAERGDPKPWRLVKDP